MSDDPTEDICDAIVDWLSAVQEDTNPFDPISFEAVKPEDPLGELDSVPSSLKVIVVPNAEAEEKIGRPKFLEIHQVSLWITRTTSSEWTRERLSGFVRTLKEQLRGVKMATYTYSMIETASKFDPDRLHKGQFFSVVVVTYRGIPAELTEET